jgi:hypothetical protein
MAANTADPREGFSSEMLPADFIYAWGDEFIDYDTPPSAETLKEVARALHAVDEFLIAPIAKKLKELATAEGGPNDPRVDRSYPIPEAERVVTYTDIGRLITWTDDLRKDIHFMLDSIVDIALLAHEDLQAIAAGLTTDSVLEDREWNARMRRFHGLDEPLGA